MNRREYLRTGVVASGIGAMAVLTSRRLIGADDSDRVEGKSPPSGDPTTAPPDDPTVRHANEYGTVVEAVEVGADPTGVEPVNDVIETHGGDDTLLSFPAGTYSLEPIKLVGHHHFGIAAVGEERPTFVGVTPGCDPLQYVRFIEVDEFLLEGVDFDFRSPGVGGEIRVDAVGDATVRDVSVSGSCADQIAVFRMDVLDDDGVGTVREFRAENTARDPTLTCLYVGKPHAGEVTFRDCEITGFSDNGLYGSAPGLSKGNDGVVHVDGGTYRDNNISNVRLGSTGSTARGVTIVADSPPPTDQGHVRGIRLRNRKDQVIADCDITIGSNAGNTLGGIVFHHQNAGATVRDTSIRVDRNDTPAILTLALPGAEGTPVFEGLEITGDAEAGPAVLVQGRDGTVLEDCHIDSTGDGRSGVHFDQSHDCRIVDSTIVVDKHPIVLRQSTLVIENTTIVSADGRRHVEHLEASDGYVAPQSDQ